MTRSKRKFHCRDIKKLGVKRAGQQSTKGGGKGGLYKENPLSNGVQAEFPKGPNKGRQPPLSLHPQSPPFSQSPTGRPHPVPAQNEPSRRRHETAASRGVQGGSRSERGHRERERKKKKPPGHAVRTRLGMTSPGDGDAAVAPSEDGPAQLSFSGSERQRRLPCVKRTMWMW